jgi:hypothetical protein
VAKELAARGVLNRALTEVPVELTRRLRHRPSLKGDISTLLGDARVADSVAIMSSEE